MGTTAPKILENPVCDPKPFGRILNYDQSGRILRVLPFRRQPRRARQVSVLSELTVGERGILVSLDLPENVQNHLMHMGFVPGACVINLRRAPAGDPTVYCIDGMEIALRHETAAAISVRPCTAHNASASAPAAAADSTTAETAVSQDDTLVEAAQ
jgi:Fe2+ transport system protein FeoA